MKEEDEKVVTSGDRWRRTDQSVTPLEGIIHDRPSLFSESEDASVHLTEFLGGQAGISGKGFGTAVSMTVGVSIGVRFTGYWAVSGGLEAFAMHEIPGELPSRERLEDKEPKDVSEDGHDSNAGDNNADILTTCCVVGGIEERVRI
jgi:hypothetical protein